MSLNGGDRLEDSVRLAVGATREHSPGEDEQPLRLRRGAAPASSGGHLSRDWNASAHSMGAFCGEQGRQVDGRA